MLKPFQLIAHRGGGAKKVNPGAPPENTLAAFTWAYGHGIRMCECDVQMTADEEIVVFHDFDTQRITGIEAWVTDLTAKQILSFDAGRWKGDSWGGCRVPTLTQLLAVIPVQGKLLIEIKPGPQILQPLARTLDSVTIDPGKLTLASFNLDTIRAAKVLLPELACLWILAFRCDSHGNWIAGYRTAQGAGEEVTRPADLSDLMHTVQEGNLDGIDASLGNPPQLAERLRDAGKSALVWTVNKPNAALQLINTGFCGVTTDLPLELRAALGPNAP